MSRPVAADGAGVATGLVQIRYLCVQTTDGPAGADRGGQCRYRQTAQALHHPVTLKAWVRPDVGWQQRRVQLPKPQFPDHHAAPSSRGNWPRRGKDQRAQPCGAQLQTGDFRPRGGKFIGQRHLVHVTPRWWL